MQLRRLANETKKDVGGPRSSIQDISVGFGPDRLRLNVYCKEAPGVVVYTDPAAEDEGDLDSLPGGSRPLEKNEQIHFCNLRDRYQ